MRAPPLAFRRAAAAPSDPKHEPSRGEGAG